MWNRPPGKARRLVSRLDVLGYMLGTYVVWAYLGCMWLSRSLRSSGLAVSWRYIWGRFSRWWSVGRWSVVGGRSSFPLGWIWQLMILLRDISILPRFIRSPGMLIYPPRSLVCYYLSGAGISPATFVDGDFLLDWKCVSAPMLTGSTGISPSKMEDGCIATVILHWTPILSIIVALYYIR